ncbi:MAG: 1-phosphofructokinase family hexose kinase [Spirochaetota bacterium]
MDQIVTVTANPAVDRSAVVDQVQIDVKLRMHSVQRDAGGGGINVSRAISRLGGASRALFVCGGVEGTILEELLAQEQIDAAPTRIAGAIRENLTVVEESSDKQYRFGMPGPELSADELERFEAAVRDAMQPGAWIVASGSLPPGVPTDFYARLSARAGENDCRFVVDTSGDALAAAVREGAFLIKPNLRELASLSGVAELEDPDIREAARELVRGERIANVVVSLGSAGALLVTGEGIARFSAPTVSVSSRIGAGDSMIGGIVGALARGSTMVEAVRWGVAAGAAAVMTPGTELCRGDDARRLREEVRVTEEEEVL